jgi:preprotein translocase subunit SecG
MLVYLIAFHMLLAVTLIGLVLIQRGKGAEIGAAFGSGASQTIFGSQGAASFLTRITALLATLFFLSSLGLAYVYSQQVDRPSVTEIIEREAPAGGMERGQLRPEVDIPDVPMRQPEQTGE